MLPATAASATGAAKDVTEDVAESLCKAAEHILDKGAKSVRAYATHAVLSGEAHSRINSSLLTELLVTDTLPLRQETPKIKVVSVAPLFARALSNIHNYESVSSLFLN
jgi:ribose-phosphate pyrophosphokinase